MGCSFLSKPVTEKLSDDASNDRLSYGASSMQGWRVNQEDAHNCVLDFDKSTSFFAVYDGHGGHEVAQYCSEKLPQYIKDTSAYKENDLERALIDGFLGFDQTITSPEVIETLTKLAGENLNDDGSDDEENIDNLYEEAAMPIEQVIEKYTNLANPALKNLKKGEFLKSPFLKAKKDTSSDEASCSATSSSQSENKETSKSQDSSGSSSNLETVEGTVSSEVKDEPEKSEPNGAVPQIKVSSPENLGTEESDTTTETPKNDNKSESPQNGEISDEKSNADPTSSAPQENGDVTSKGKGKAIPKNKTPKTPATVRPKRNANQLYKALLNFGQDSEDDETEDDDKTFEGPNVESSDDEDEGVNVAIEMEDSEEDGSSEEEEDEEDCDEEEDEDEEDEQDVALGDGFEKPGSDSGCTAVVAVLRENELYVANAGDSRCIVCRNGKAIEMSLDHKPEDDIERQRIEKAGGKVNWEGRVNGGLNLSRAIGDHSYKQNKELSDREQMITSLPDIKTLTVNPKEDEFMVLACDGIWNFMSSQEVVDFVRPRINTCDKLSKICEEMFDHCLAPNTFGDGTGCDNMTAIIVQFKSNICKRSAPPETSNTDSKRAKTEEKVHIESTV
ncbi:probable protein phosphatase CG10417 isoform X2 [Leptinotarsa decemlineata]|uniref:probable protein phosphatase CG10417 isoform X2 n=1 Tax=Leptinotarsa decemlineata TaxID=7539 RepID=UPI003D30439A